MNVTDTGKLNLEYIFYHSWIS